MGKRAAFHNLGCKVNSYETEAMQRLLEKLGFQRRGTIFVREDNDPRIAYEK